MDQVEERRQRAREAAYDAVPDESAGARLVEAAIETATRVKITPEIVEAARKASPWIMQGEARNAVEAAFRAAGFEVEG